MSKKVGVITYHFVVNYGALLQTYALNTYLKNQGYDVEVIDYRAKEILLTDNVRILPISKNFNTIACGLKTIPDRLKKKKKFKNFFEKNLKLSKTYYLSSQIKKNPPKYDYYITGSDQVFNPFITFGNFGPYMLDFVKAGKKTSYSASFGGSSIKDKYKPEVKKYLSTFDSISVREESGIPIIKELLDVEVTQCVDPTLLLNKEDWEKIASENKYDFEYVLIYNMFRSEEMYRQLEQFKKETGVKIIEISRYGDSDKCVDHSLINIGIEEFLSLFMNATYVCTNSFHGTAFAVNFRKPFVSFPSNRFNTRIENFLTVLDLKSRLFEKGDRLTKEAFKYDVQNVTEKIDAYVIESKKYLENALK